MSTGPPTWQNWQRRKPKQLCSHYMLWDQPFFFVLAKFRQKEKLKIWKMKWFQRVSIAKSKGKKTPVFYIWFSVCSHKHRIFILNFCASYPVPKDDGHFCYEGSRLRLHKKFLQKKNTGWDLLYAHSTWFELNPNFLKWSFSFKTLPGCFSF